MAEHKLKGLNGKVLSLKNNNYLTKDKSVIYLDDVTDFTVNIADGLEVGSIAHVSGERGGTFELGSSGFLRKDILIESSTKLWRLNVDDDGALTTTEVV